MKRTAFHIAISTFLVVLLLFSQIGVDFLHSEHDEHKPGAGRVDYDTVQEHGDHCSVCSVDIFNHAFISEVTDFQTVRLAKNPLPAKSTRSSDRLFFFSRDRAPPTPL